jgi:AcrR family transcriptional regulator
MDIKQKLESAALRMFSQNGYAAVSVRDLSKAVGRRETCVYHYFRNKRDLLGSLAAEFETRTKAVIGELRGRLKQAETIDRAAFMRLSGEFLSHYLTEPYFVQFTRILLIEQANDESLHRMYTNYLFMIPLIYMKDLFTRAEKTGAYSVDFLSTSYYGTLLLYYQKHLMGGSPGKAAGDAFIMEAGPHMSEFAKTYIAG